jgi:hypothetical protein
LQLAQVWNSFLASAPFHGILGFSQGAALAGFLPMIERRQDRFSNIKFVILASGYNFQQPYPSKSCGGITDFLAPIEALPSLHIIGRANSVVPQEESLALARRFDVSTILLLYKCLNCLQMALKFVISSSPAFFALINSAS